MSVIDANVVIDGLEEAIFGLFGFFLFQPLQGISIAITVFDGFTFAACFAHASTATSVMTLEFAKGIFHFLFDTHTGSSTSTTRTTAVDFLFFFTRRRQVIEDFGTVKQTGATHLRRCAGQGFTLGKVHGAKVRVYGRIQGGQQILHHGLELTTFGRRTSSTSGSTVLTHFLFCFLFFSYVCVCVCICKLAS